MPASSIKSSFIDLSSRSKLLIYQLITVGITFLIFLIIQTQVQNLVLNETAGSSNYLLQYTADKSIQQYQSRMERLMSYHFIKIFNRHLNQNRLYKWAQIYCADVQIEQYQSTISVINGTLIEYFLPPNQFEIGIYNLTKPSQFTLNSSFKLYTQIFDSFPVNAFEDNEETGHVISSVDDSNVVGVWKLLHYTNYSTLPLTKYDPHVRSWYINQINSKNSTYVIGSIYQNYITGLFGYAMTSSLTSLDNKIEYVLAYLGSFNDFANLMQIQNISLMITDQKGRIIQWNDRKELNFSFEDIRIYNQVKTGFNYLDWLEFMRQISQTNNGISLCENYFCRYNTLTDQYTHTQIISVGDQFFIFIFLDAKNEIQQHEQSVDFQNRMEQVQYELSLYSLAVFIFIILLGQIILYYIFQPFQDLVLLIHKDLDIQRSLNLQILKQQYRNQNMDQLNKLLLSYYKIKNQLSNMQRNKSCECKMYDSFKYPQTNFQIQLELNEIEMKQFVESLGDASSIKVIKNACPKIIRMMSGRNILLQTYSQFEEIETSRALRKSTFEIIVDNIQG